ADSHAGVTSVANRFVDFVNDQFAADLRWAPFLPDVRDVFVLEVAQSREHRVRRSLTQPAQGSVLYHPAAILEQLEIRLFAFALRDPVEDCLQLLGSFAARKALSAGLFFQELHEIAGEIDHAGVFIHDHHAARAHHRTCRSKSFVIDGKIDHAGRNAAAGGAADLNGFQLFAFGYAAADVVDHF